jgi:hypothetical protein
LLSASISAISLFYLSNKAACWSARNFLRFAAAVFFGIVRSTFSP